LVTLVDANVLIDLFIDDPEWSQWSLSQLRACSSRGPLYINDIIYAECSTRFDSADDFEAALATAGVIVRRTAPSALFLAGKAYRQDRRARGLRNGVLSDFFIGAHDAVEGIPLLTRDTKRYRSYFSSVTLIAPDEPEL
jgi:predicted nucleic acid-binding protein